MRPALRHSIATDEAAPRGSRWEVYEKRVKPAWSERDGWHASIRTVHFPGEQKPRRVRIYTTAQGGRIETEREAVKVCYQIITQLVDGRQMEDVLAEYQKRKLPGNLVAARWETFCDDKLQDVGSGRLDKRRVRELRAYIRRGYFASFTETDVHEIDRPALLAWIRFLRLRDLAEKTIKNVLMDFGQFLRWLRDTGVLREVPKIPSDRLRVVKHARTIPERADLERLLDQIPLPIRGLWLARAFMGLRPSEARRVDVRDLREHGQALQLLGSKTKTRTPRLLPLAPELDAWLHAPEVVAAFGELEQRFGAEPLFKNPQASNEAKRWTEKPEWMVFQRALAAAGFEGLKPNEAGRHFFITDLVDRTGDVYLAKRWAGHQDIATTEGYVGQRARSLRRPIALQSGRRSDDGPETRARGSVSDRDDSLISASMATPAGFEPVCGRTKPRG